jgi:ferredoxin-NAD(P)+ reductase (naphthalene dioxygenase ferredoxin-specific)
VPEPDEVIVHPARILKATVVAIEDMTHDIKRLRLRTTKPLSFSPGQYAQLQFGREHTRPYSMAGLSSDQELEFHVRLVANGRVTGYVASQLQAGDAVKVSGPLGTAYLRTRHEGPMLCVAGGTGLAPVLSIVRGALASGMKNPIHVYLGVRSPQDIYGLQWLDELAAAHANLRVQVVVAMGSDGKATRRGLVTDAVAQDWDSLAGWRAYLCGAPAMVEAAALLVKQKGIEPDHLHADAFYPASN